MVLAIHVQSSSCSEQPASCPAGVETVRIATWNKTTAVHSCSDVQRPYTPLASGTFACGAGGADFVTDGAYTTIDALTADGRVYARVEGMFADPAEHALAFPPDHGFVRVSWQFTGDAACNESRIIETAVLGETERIPCSATAEPQILPGLAPGPQQLTFVLEPRAEACNLPPIDARTVSVDVGAGETADVTVTFQ